MALNSRTRTFHFYTPLPAFFFYTLAAAIPVQSSSAAVSRVVSLQELHPLVGHKREYDLCLNGDIQACYGRCVDKSQIHNMNIHWRNKKNCKKNIECG